MSQPPIFVPDTEDFGLYVEWLQIYFKIETVLFEEKVFMC